MASDINLIYYLQVNIIAIVMAVVLLIQERRISSKNETSHIITNILMVFMIIFSLADIFAYISRGNSAVGVQISNSVYFIMMALGSYTWFLFICIKMGYFSNFRKLLLWTAGPMVILAVAILLNPIHGFFFTVDEANLYHRGNGLFVTWFVEWGYMISATVLNIISVVKEKRSYKRGEYFGYIFFVLPLLIAALLQMIFYGTTTIQIGFMFSVFMAYVNRQAHQTQKDGLTGLNNKNAFLSYRDTFINRNRELNLTFFVMDADNFKSINDKHGHLKGDQALVDIASILESSIKQITSKRLALYRYAGDEFVIIGNNLEDEEIAAIRDAIASYTSKANEINKSKGEQYNLSLSVGVSTKQCSNEIEFDELLKEADEDMYKHKSSSPRRGRNRN